MGTVAGSIIVHATQPFGTIKTRTQRARGGIDTRSMQGSLPRARSPGFLEWQYYEINRKTGD